MITVEEIRKEVNRIVDILKEAKTIEDCRSLRKYGYDEDSIVVMFSDGIWMNLKDVLLTKNSENREIDGIGLYDNETKSGISYISYMFKDVFHKVGDIFFDVFNVEYNEDYNMLEDVTPDTLEEEYAKAMEIFDKEM